MKLASLFLFLMCLPFTTKPMLSEMLKDFDDSDIHFPAIFADKVSNTLNPIICRQKLTEIVNKWIIHNYDLNTPIGSIVNEWIAKKYNARFETRNNQRLLHRTCLDESASDLTAALLKAGADPNATDDYGQTPLHFACPREIENARILLEHGANPNMLASTATENRRTLLHSCFLAHAPNKSIVKLLLMHGADIFIKDSAGNNPYDFNQRNPYYTETCSSDSLKMIDYAKHIILHKPAYLYLLTDKNRSIFKRLPTDVIKMIIDAMFSDYPPWPKENYEQLIERLQQKK